MRHRGGVGQLGLCCGDLGHALGVGLLLGGDVLLGPVQQRRHDRQDLVGGGQAPVTAREVQAHPAQQDVVEALGALVGDGPGDLGAQVGGGLGQRLAQALLGTGGVDGLKQGRGLVAVAVQQVGDPLQGPAALTGDPPGPLGQGVVAGRTHQGQLLRGAGVGVGQGLAQGVVDGVGGHDPVGGQLTAGDGGQPRGDPGDRVLTGDLRGGSLGTRLELGLEQGAQARVDADDVGASDGPRQHGVGVLEDVVDIGGGGHGLGDVQIPGGVGGADDPVLGPGDDEQD